MTVERLRDILNDVANGANWELYKNSLVVISVEDSRNTVGSRPYTKVRSVGMGFDWEAGQFRIEPENKLMEVSKRK